MDCYPEQDGNTNVVFNVHWRVRGYDGEYDASALGCTSILLDRNAEFVPFAELTQDEVIGWVKAEWDASAALAADQPPSRGSSSRQSAADYEQLLAQMIADQINPPVVTPPLPWS
jgi:hypothetical protein